MDNQAFHGLADLPAIGEPSGIKSRQNLIKIGIFKDNSRIRPSQFQNQWNKFLCRLLVKDFPDTGAAGKADKINVIRDHGLRHGTIPVNDIQNPFGKLRGLYHILYFAREKLGFLGIFEHDCVSRA